MRNMSKFLVILVAAALFALPLSARAWDGNNTQSSEYFEPEQPGAGMMMWDLIAVRPFSIAASVVGSAFFIVSYPFSALGGNTDAATEKLVKEPFRYTFSRPLGEF
jgi:hypothetical protein